MSYSLTMMETTKNSDVLLFLLLGLLAVMFLAYLPPKEKTKIDDTESDFEEYTDESENGDTNDRSRNT